VIPVPGHSIAVPYGARGGHWSCDRDSNGDGIHTGVDYPAPHGTPVVAARPGTVNHCHHGDAFGYQQVEVLPGDGTRDFYAHMQARTLDGLWVKAGEQIGEVGDEGNTTGPHLHFERHAIDYGGWSCAIVRDPQPSIDYQQEEDVDYDKIRQIVAEEVKANNDNAAKATWDKAITVTEPDGDETTKPAKQLLRQVWQKVSRGL
jgi:murein DD-endopeptidase MepM/ murein hydrolase activator NlpD